MVPDISLARRVRITWIKSRGKDSPDQENTETNSQGINWHGMYEERQQCHFISLFSGRQGRDRERRES